MNGGDSFFLKENLAIPGRKNDIIKYCAPKMGQTEVFLREKDSNT